MPVKLDFKQLQSAEVASKRAQVSKNLKKKSLHGTHIR